MIEDLTNISWNNSINTSGTDGCYKKAIINNRYYKLPAFSVNNGFYGNEVFYEVIAGRLGKILGFNVLSQQLVKAKVRVDGVVYTAYACKSMNYVKNGYKRIAFEDFYSLYRKQSETVQDFIKRVGLQHYFDAMYVFDYIIMNRDRHGANIEILKNTSGKFELAPYFDNGISFLGPITKDLPNFDSRVRKFEVFQDMPVNNFVGSRSLLSNLVFISGSVTVKPLRKEDKRAIFEGMNRAMSKELVNKVWEIIAYRYYFLRKRGVIVDGKNI